MAENEGDDFGGLSRTTSKFDLDADSIRDGPTMTLANLLSIIATRDKQLERRDMLID